MAAMRELQKRLKSTAVTCKLAGAMRSAATAKYHRLSGVNADYSEYESALSLVPAKCPDTEASGDNTVCLLISGNRGLCGGYHHELFAYFTDEVLKDDQARVMVCGKRAFEFCREKKIDVIKEFTVSDVPSFEEAKSIADFISELQKGSRADKVTAVFMSFSNMLKQIPTSERLLPFTDETVGGEEETIFLPDRETVESELLPLKLAASVYSKLLSAAAGVQAATMLAMRAAYDNAERSLGLLETRINRMRQAAVTASVIETSTEVKE